MPEFRVFCKLKHRKQSYKKRAYLLTYLLTYLITPWSRVLLEKINFSASQEISSGFLET